MKKIDLDFTSLLDILLILLFAFILNANAESAQKDKETAAKLEAAENKVASLTAQVEAQSKEIAKWKEELEQAKTAAEELKNSTDQYKKDLEKTLAALRKTINQPNLSLQTWHNYQVMAKKFLVIEVSIIAPENRLVINQKKQAVYLSLDDISDSERKSEKMKKIEDLIEKEIDNSTNSGNLILISAGKDVNIPRLIYNLLWDSIRNVESKYGKEKLFKTEFYLP
ncbi:MAG: hypothetical protein Q4A29_00855 [Eubacteriales bacterium]|nr:hypothetical protein [Eubacteriales bacterium]